MAELEQLASLGTVWSYNNAGFSVAGRIIEVVTGQPFHVALQELVLDPLGLTNAYLNPTDVMPHRFATGHQDGDDGPEIAFPSLSRCEAPMGGLITNVSALLKYAEFHLGMEQAWTGPAY
ncbi:beta-lactamase family protein [Chloroflexi bacterium TSY]|nr:beta-lactamase family protein [Chloroflexi bacterium TSY]